jgi:hypothetical protein
MSQAVERPRVVPPAMPGLPLPDGRGAALAPPFRLPGQHFAAALGFWLAGAIALVGIAPDVAQGLFPLPRVVAVTHLFTLGWITTSILGALYQFLPVALGVPIRWQRLAHVTFWLYAPGLVLFAVGLVGAAWPAVLGGAVLFASGLLLFLANLGATLGRCRARDITWWALAAAGVFLLATIALGLALATNLGRGFLGAHRFLAVTVHAHVALFGWVLLVVIGVAQRLLPMFLLSHGAPEWPGKAAAALVGAGVGGLALLHHVVPMAVYWGPGLLIALGAVAFLLQAGLFFRHRKRPALDAGLRLAAIALGFLALALALAPFALSRGFAAPRVGTAYLTALIVGGFGLFVAGHYYKILPFLVVFHRYGHLMGKRPIPRTGDLYDDRVARAAVALLAAGTLGLVLSTLAGAPLPARVSAIAFAAGAATEVAQMYAISRRRPE